MAVAPLIRPIEFQASIMVAAWEFVHEPGGILCAVIFTGTTMACRATLMAISPA